MGRRTPPVRVRYAGGGGGAEQILPGCAVYLVARGRIADQIMHDEYVEKALPTIPASARVVCFDLASEVVEGDPADSRTVIIEFPSRDEFRAWYDSPAYREVLPLRLESVPGNMVVVEGFVPPAE